MSLFERLFTAKKKNAPKQEETPQPVLPDINDDKLMLSQFAACYVGGGDDSYRKKYISNLTQLKLSKQDAQAMFAFDCAVIKKYNKSYLLNPDFTRMWFFGLKQPFFLAYPKEKADILKERFLTMSELCKIIDEAEWHFWNSHEREMSDEVWREIYEWRINVAGAEFAMQYFEMIADATKIPMDSIGAICRSQGAHLSKYKWR